MNKSKLRKKILKIRINKNKNNIKIEPNKIFNLIKKVMKNKKIVGGYFPVNCEIDDLVILKELYKKNVLFATEIQFHLIQVKFINT